MNQTQRCQYTVSFSLESNDFRFTQPGNKKHCCTVHSGSNHQIKSIAGLSNIYVFCIVRGRCLDRSLFIELKTVNVP